LTAILRRLRRLPAILLLGFATACASRQAPRPVPTIPARTGAWEEGVASWYGGKDGFEGKPTASGEIYDGNQMTAAHRTLPLGTVVEVQNLENGKTARVRINDRGPFIKGRILDLSRTAAGLLGLIGPGIATIRLTIVTPGVEAPPVSPSGLWAVQVGSFADRGHAERHAERARATGRNVYLEPYRGLSRVKVGPYDSRAEALEILGQLENEGFEGIVVAAGK
jgi:rare lipoprotein A